MKKSLSTPESSLDHLNRSVVANMVKDFMEAVEQVVQTTGRTKIQPRTKAATLMEHAHIHGDAAGSLSFQGDYSGQFIISFSKDAICEIATSMLYADTPYTSHRHEDVEGAIGEMTNQIAGQGRMKINERTGWKASNGIPSVIVGENISWTLYTTGTLIVHIPYTTPNANEMYVEVAVSAHPATGDIKI